MLGNLTIKSGHRQVRKPSLKAEQVADLLHGTAIRLLRFVRKEDAAAGITGPQLSVLSVLVTVTEKGKRLLEAGRKRRLAKLAAALSALPVEQLETLREASELIAGVTEFTI